MSFQRCSCRWSCWCDYKMIHAPRIWLRKVDDTFAISAHNTELILKELNAIHKDVQFTAEEELNLEIPFLDCLIKRNKENSVETKVYKKNRHTGQYMNFESNYPLSVKLSTIKTLVKRENTICTSKSELDNEITYIQRTMELIGFPKKLTERTIENSLKEKVNK